MEYLDNNNGSAQNETQSKKTNNISNYLEFSLANESSKQLDDKSSKFKLPIIKSPR